MANKKSFFGLKFVYDTPATLTFAFICIALFAVDTLLLKNQLGANYLCSPTTAGGKLAFMASNPLSYIRLISFAFGAASSSALICNMIFILLLGSSMEERYGTIVIAIMMIVSALFSGVLNACFCKTPLTGCSAVIFMMIFLNSFVSLSKKKIPVSFILVFILFVCREIFDSGNSAVSTSFDGGIKIIINIAGGLCGSLFAFLTSPKAKAAKKSETSEGGLLNRASRLRESSKPKTSFFKRKNADTVQATYSENNGSSSSSGSGGDETVISSMRFED